MTPLKPVRHSAHHQQAPDFLLQLLYENDMQQVDANEPNALAIGNLLYQFWEHAKFLSSLVEEYKRKPENFGNVCSRVECLGRLIGYTERISEFSHAVEAFMRETKRLEMFLMGFGEEGSEDRGVEKMERGLLRKREECVGMGKMLVELRRPLVQRVERMLLV